MGTGVILNVRLAIRTVATAALFLAVASLVRAQTQDESFDEKLRKAAEAYAKKSQSEEEEQKRLAAAFAAKREAMQKQEEAELRQAELDFRQRMASLRLEEAARLRELETKLKGNEEQLAKAVAHLKANMLAKEAESERAFAKKRDTFSQEVKAKVAAELAKAEAERERQKQIAMMVAMTYFTGGAALPALAASGATASAAGAAKASSATKAAAPAIAGKASTGNAGMSPGAKRFADFLASQPNATHAKTGLPVNANRLGTPSAVRGPTPGVMLDSGRLDPDWLDPAMYLVGEAIQAARGLGTVVASRFGWAKSAPKPLSGGPALLGGEQAGSTRSMLGKVVSPRGAGAATGAVPANYVRVSRWVNEAEAKLWMANEGTTIPAGIGTQGERIYVTLPGATRPGGTGPIRVDFSVPKESLQGAGKGDWRQIFQPMQNTPIYNVEIHYPR